MLRRVINWWRALIAPQRTYTHFVYEDNFKHPVPIYERDYTT